PRGAGERVRKPAQPGGDVPQPVRRYRIRAVRVVGEIGDLAPKLPGEVGQFVKAGSAEPGESFGRIGAGALAVNFGHDVGGVVVVVHRRVLAFVGALGKGARGRSGAHRVA